MKFSIEGRESNLSFIVIPFDEKPTDEDLDDDELIMKYMMRSHTFSTMQAAKECATFLVRVGAAQYCMIDLVVTALDEKTGFPDVVDEITVAEVEFVIKKDDEDEL